MGTQPESGPASQGEHVKATGEQQRERAKPLVRVRVLDLSRLVAGALTGMLLADFGADVVKVEQPGAGDPLRQWTTGGQPFWWKVYARNKRLITLNLRDPAGGALLRRLIPRFDVMIESFVPGTLEQMGFGWDVLRNLHPRLILLRISGWGQHGPSSARPGFGTLVEAASGFAAMNGEPDGAPIVPSFPLADMTSGLYGCSAIMFALHHREMNSGVGQCIDVSLFESLFSVLGPLAAEYDALGCERIREGSRSKNSGPRGCYRTRDGGWIAVSGSTPKMAERFLRSYGLDALLTDPRFATNEARVQHGIELDDAVAGAIALRSLSENVDIIEAHGLTATPVQTIADIERDPHWRARELTVSVPDSAGTIRMHNVFPRFSDTPGDIRWAGGKPGQDNAAVYGELGLGPSDLAQLHARGVI